MSYIVIEDWMMNELNLKGNELLVYGLIHGFSQDGESSFRGSRKYISNTLNISLPTVDKALNNLVEHGLIIKESVMVNNVVFNTYKVGSKVSLPPIKKNEEKSNVGSKVSLHNNTNNIYNYTNSKLLDNYISINNKRKSLYEKCMDLIDEYTDDPKLKEALTRFLDSQLSIYKEKGLTFYSTILKNRLNKLKTFDEDDRLDIVNTAVDNGWQNFYKKSYQRKTDNVTSQTYTQEELDNLPHKDDKF